LLNQKSYVNAHSEFEKIKDINDELALLRQKRDKFDEKYETRRFWEMVAMEDYDNHHDEKLKNMLIEDREELEREKRRKEQEAMEREMMLNQEFDGLEEEDD
jgi:hypothetical protein